tara:strand:- start:13 stop:234 length:222 start_codon:yes stop_codon:yes gene_type:complete
MKIGQRINHVRKSNYPTPTDILDTGTITGGPYRIPGEAYLHYNVKWDSLGDSLMNELPQPLSGSRKYEYKLAK